jgi:hypothetical protein
MKAKGKNSQGGYLQAKNHRWKWMAGATAAGVTASQANTITINLLNNYISATGGNHLNADLTGDGHPDLTIAGAAYSVFNPIPPGSGGFTYPSYNKYFARVDLNGVHAQAYADNDYGFGTVRLGSQTNHFGARSVTGGVHPYASLIGSIPIFFKDLHINNGALIKGTLDVTVFAEAGWPNNDTRIQLDSFTYATPDQGSSLALLAMGAGGILAFRRWRATQQLP